MVQAAGKSKQISVRMTNEEWLLIRDEAFAKGKEMGPFVAKWIARRIKRLKDKRDQELARRHQDK